ncbi:EboA domain-containing protein [Streptomyces sp. NPDC060322]|uniref:EboA domain-containing protein n=1 Tax=unclassified Streptomyces TaxID=2593676 RepID=UPI0036563329
MALHTALEARLEPSARAWLDGALDAAAEAVRPGAATATQPVMPAWELRFAEAGRHCGTEDAADHARILLLYTARAEAGSTIRLYHQGTAAERRAILLALPHLGLDPSQGLPLVEDALRTNDPRLVAAAVGPYGAAHLDTHGWRHAVLKCLFTEVPVEAVARLGERARGDAELARMLDDYARERTAAGRAVPGDLLQVRALTGEETEES